MAKMVQVYYKRDGAHMRCCNACGKWADPRTANEWHSTSCKHATALRKYAVLLHNAQNNAAVLACDVQELPKSWRVLSEQALWGFPHSMHTMSVVQINKSARMVGSMQLHWFDDYDAALRTAATWLAVRADKLQETASKMRAAADKAKAQL
jgi:hypothetical protein